VSLDTTECLLTSDRLLLINDLINNVLERFEACKAGDWVKAKAVSDAYVEFPVLELMPALTPTPRQTTSSLSMLSLTMMTTEVSRFPQTHRRVQHRHNRSRSSVQHLPVFPLICSHRLRPVPVPSRLRSLSQLPRLRPPLSDKILWRSSTSPCDRRRNSLYNSNSSSSSRHLQPSECPSSQCVPTVRRRSLNSNNNKHRKRTLLPTSSTSCRSQREGVVL
jgi:hypothetical protein